MEKEIVDSYIRAGNIADEIKKRLKNYVKPNVKLLDIANFVEDYIKEQGADIAFPTNLSINEIAAHYTPVPNDDKEAYGVLKIDFGVSVDGFIADTAISFDLTENNEYKQMLEINRSVS